MLSRISLLIVLFSSMGFGGFALGHLRAHLPQSDAAAIPGEHPIALALESKAALKLSPEQVAQLQSLKGSMAKELAPFLKQAHDIEAKFVEMHAGGGKAEDFMPLKKQMGEIESKVQPIFEKYAGEVAKLLSQEQKEILTKIANERMAKRGSTDFPLMFLMDHRQDFGISPQQFTKLQMMQAEFIMNFAPMREQMEMLQMQIEQTMQKEHKEPPKEMLMQVQQLERHIRELKMQISHRAIEQVLSPEQQQKLKKMLHESSEGHSD